MTAAIKVSIIVPAYNEENTIETVLSRLLKVCQNLPSSEIIVIDDGSTDDTAERVERFSSVGLVRQKNQGKGAALRTGLRVSKGDIIVIQDADMEYHPEDIPRLIEPILKEKADAVYGSRFKGNTDGMSFSHYIGNRIISLSTRILFGVSVTDVMTGHKAFHRKIFNPIPIKEKGFTVEIEITARILRNNWRLIEIPIAYSYRKHGVAKINYADGLRSLLKVIRERF
jgi:glycosyltransferase involved in cell wall biosynthesis